MPNENTKRIIRKRPAHMPVLESGFQSPIIFLTVCTYRRKRILDHKDVHALLVSIWEEAGKWSVGRYVIMPDHIHMFCEPSTNPAVPLRAWVKFWKSRASMRWAKPDEAPVWQQDIWDTQLRRRENYYSKWEYVRENPVRAGLVKTAEEWPYQGELCELRWHDS